MRSQDVFQRKLFEKFQELKLRNPQFSLRAFSKKLGIGAGAVSQILNGKRRVSVKVAEKICERLVLDPLERSQFLAPFLQAETSTLEKISPQERFLKLSKEQFLIVSKWQHFGILSLVKIKGFQNNSKWIATRLGISEKEASAATKRLLEMKLLTETESGSLKRVNNPIRTSDDFKDLTVRAAHLETLELAREALTHIDVDQRDYSTLTLPLDPEKLGKAKELIRDFQTQFFDLMENAEKGSEVYRLSMELFPLTVLEKK